MSTMDVTFLVICVMLALSIAAPFISLAAIGLARRGEYSRHRFVQNLLFGTCVSGVIALEVAIRFAGGSGSLIRQGPYYDFSWFKYLLVCHIIGAVLTYIVWGYLILASNMKFKSTLPGSFSKRHKTLGIGVIAGLVYTAITASIICYFTFIIS